MPSRGSGGCQPRSARGSLVPLAFGSPPAPAGKLSHLVLSIYLCGDSCWKELIACPNPVTLVRQQGRETPPRQQQAAVRSPGGISPLGTRLAIARSRLATAKSKVVAAKITGGHGPGWQPWPRSKAVVAQVGHGLVEGGHGPGPPKTHHLGPPQETGPFFSWS